MDEFGYSDLPQSKRQLQEKKPLRTLAFFLFVVSVALIVTAIGWARASKDSTTPIPIPTPTPQPTIDTSSVGDRLIAGIWTQTQMPLTTQNALLGNWTMINPGQCEKEFGYRYRYQNRSTPTLLYNNRGILVGMQMVVETATFPLYPASNLRSPPFVDMAPYGDPGRAALSAYFSDPMNLCDSPEPLTPTSSSIGDRLWFRQGLTSNAQIDFEVIPLLESDLQKANATNGFKSGGCAPSGFAYNGSVGMGLHYWRYLKVDQVCIDAGPLFLLYSRGKLVAFGFTFVGTDNRVPTEGNIPPTLKGKILFPTPPCLWEFATQPLYPYFFQQSENPHCLQNLNRFNSSLPDGTITTGTLHFFLTNPYNLTCA